MGYALKNTFIWNTTETDEIFGGYGYALAL